jgi:tetratricopeptide (TPR) repeat protein
MLSGQQPFSAPDTRRLERLIVSRRAAPSLDGDCPVALQAVVAKLLGPAPADRYASADAIRADLERCQAGELTQAQEEGWPGKAADEPATRRTRRPEDDLDETTRRTFPLVGAPTVLPPPLPPVPDGLGKPMMTAAGVVATSAPPAASPVAAPAHPRSRASRYVRRALVALAVLLVLNEMWIARAGSRAARTVGSQELEALDSSWSEYRRLSSRSLGPGTWRLERVLRQRTTTLTDRVMATYRDGLQIVWEPQWQTARDSLARAVAASPDRSELRASLRYCDGHLHRINGDARKSKGDPDAARREYAEAVSAFREAAQLRPRWPDPFIGLSRTFIAGLGDVDRGADALKQAQGLGYTPGARETAQLAGGYRDRGDTLARNARELAGMPQERDLLNRAVTAYQRALDLYAGIATFTGVPASIRRTQAGLDKVQQRTGELDGSTFDINLGPLGTLSIKKNAAETSPSAPGVP